MEMVVLPARIDDEAEGRLAVGLVFLVCCMRWPLNSASASSPANR